MTDDGVWDPGLQPERTYLAWRRLGLAFLGLAAVVPKLAWVALGVWSIPAAILLGGGAVVLMTIGHRRYRRIHAALTAPTTTPLPDGRLAAFTAILSLLLGAVALAVVVSAASALG